MNIREEATARTTILTERKMNRHGIYHTQ